MKFSVTLLRPAALLASLVLMAGLWASVAQAKTVHSLTGNARGQIGDGLPIPIGFTPAPVGKIKAQPGATVQQTLGPDPKALAIGDNAFTYGVLNPSTRAQVIGVYGANNILFQVMTNLSFPGAANAGTSFKAGGRSGAATVTYCPGQAVPNPIPSTWNPTCGSPTQGSINGLIRYKKTANQFGGAGAQAPVGGSANVAIVVGSGPNVPGGANCKAGGPGCLAQFGKAAPYPTAGNGAPWGWAGSTPGTAPGPASGVAKVNAATNGTITNVISITGGLGAPNTATTFGAPWTTGMITVQANLAQGGPETLVLTGADNRVSGVGTLSLVAANVSARTVTGPNANRGWLNMTIGAGIPATPAIPPGGLAAIAGLLTLAGGYVVRRRQANKQ
jgi:hypothetical protein